MPDLPTKDEIVERLAEALTDDEATHWVSGWRVEYALKVLTVRDLLRLLELRGVAIERRYQPVTGKPYWEVASIMIEGEPTIYKHLGIEKPDA